MVFLKENLIFTPVLLLVEEDKMKWELFSEWFSDFVELKYL
eukprot:CAMPEP_0204821604 /NCGR_PEP_ID=MMETSP1018-20131115/34570_1 /ASSEMBLY_ACC=CAM_ASM_000518 /TAXON_ID=46462 /ORGANISM="Anophryoides haemophila, Strain AH6" /LENGTH=40 /DNA_ID= /DNA_START= /DNA_END= /DNA_ORIENTATION=